MSEKSNQIAIRNINIPVFVSNSLETDAIEWWISNYLDHAVTTSKTSRKVQERDLMIFSRFCEWENSTERMSWTPRLSRAFQDFLKSSLNDQGKRSWSDRTANRILAHVKTFSKWIHTLASFPLGDPMKDIRLMPVGSGLDVEKALSSSERRKLLDTADVTAKTSGRSSDRRRNRNIEPINRPLRKNARPWRNRAIIYTIIETGMRRSAVVCVNIEDIDWDRNLISVREKGDVMHSYSISEQGIKAVKDYIDIERQGDANHNSHALFLPAASISNSTGRLTPIVINQIWNEICTSAGISGKSPHSARHAMGRHIISKSGNIEAVQKQLGHRNAAYSIQYSRITNAELNKIINDRN